MWRHSKTTGTGLTIGLFLTVTVLNVEAVALADTQLATVISGAQRVEPAGIHSAGLAEIVRLVDAKMDDKVLLTYIQNSAVAYNPDATELIALKDHGASPDVLVALLHHGDELRRQWAQVQRSVNPQPVTTAYNPVTTYPSYPYDYTDVSYSYSCPTVYYNSGWPLVYWPPLPFGGYRPFPHGHFPIRGGDARIMGGGVNHAWANAVPSPRAMHPVSMPVRGNIGIPAVHPGGFRGPAPAGRMGGQPMGGRPMVGRPGGGGRR